MPVTVTLGKDVNITGVSNAKSATISASATEIDVTVLGDTNRKFRKGLIEQTIEVECVDLPGVSVGSNFTITGTQTGDATYVCTSVSSTEPLDGIISYTVSGTRAPDPVV